MHDLFLIKYYQDNKTGINRSNLDSLRLFALINVPVSILNVVAQRALAPREMILTYLVLVYSAAIAFLSRFVLKKDNRHGTALLYLAEFPPILVSVLNGTILDPSNEAFSYMFYGILMPVMILDFPLRLFLYQSAWSVMLLILSRMCKPDIFHDDLIHIMQASLVGAAIDLVVVSARMKEIDRTRKTEIAAMQDSLTGIGNQNRFLKRISQTMKEQTALICFAVDSCEIVNDMFGHDVGDGLLEQFASVLKKHFGEDSSYRWAGSLFFATIVGRNKIQVRLQSSIGQCLSDFTETTVRGIRLKPSISAGYVIDVPKDPDHLRDIIRLADLRTRQSRYSTSGRVIGGEFDASMLDPKTIGYIMRRYQGTASRDELTGMMRSTSFVSMCENLIGQQMMTGGPLCIIYLNVIGMKHYNEKYGFTAGDRLIREIAELIAAHFPGDTASRLGGDHFMIFTYAQGAQGKVQAIDRQLQARHENKPVSVKAGEYILKDNDPVALACDRAKAATDSIRREEALIRVYDDELENEIRTEQFLIGGLNHAISQGQIAAYYQPIYDAQTGRMYASEALARWIDPERGMISPGIFIPVLESARLITRLDLEIIDQVIAGMVLRRKKGERCLPVSVNLSRYDLKDASIVGTITEKMDAAGIEHSQLVIEITESAFEGKGQFDRLNEMVRSFQARGFQVWMDDFGSGYSSLNMLEETSFNLIKLDMQFMRSKNPERARTLVREIIHMARSIGMETLVEGVETREQLDSLKQIGAGKIQGFYYSRPLPEEELEKFLTQPGGEEPSEG